MKVSITMNQNRNIGDNRIVNLAQNRREIIPENVDIQLISENIVYKSRTILETYIEAFGDAIGDYNRKKERKDRIKFDCETYFEHLFDVSPDSESAQAILTSKARGNHEIKSFNEVLFQVGDCYDFGHFARNEYGNFLDINGNHLEWDKENQVYYDVNGNEISDSRQLLPNPNAEIAKNILSIFYLGGRFRQVFDDSGKPLLVYIDADEAKQDDDIFIPSFEERNPSFQVIYAVQHNDEWCGAPHIHIDFVPVGSGYTKGPKKQVGYQRALENMGFTDKRIAYKQWREKECDLLKEICSYFGLEATSFYDEDLEKVKETANSIIAYAQQEASEIKRQATLEAEAIKAESQREISATKRLLNEIKNKIDRLAFKDILEAKEVASGIIGRANFKADKIQQEAEDKAKEIIANSHEDADRIIREVEEYVIQAQEKLDVILNASAILECKIQRELEKLNSLSEIRPILMRSKDSLAFSNYMYMMTEKEYDWLIDIHEKILNLLKKSHLSDSDRESSALIRRCLEQLKTKNGLIVTRERLRENWKSH
ncbi:MAG: hypothetical protein MSH49_00660 [[Eubacterium] saphenum]|nr:hypothetical protein [[Eubacterium] saphenum]